MAILFNSQTPRWAWLSNFWPCEIRDKQGRIWWSAEHAYQACKADDEETQAAIGRAGSGKKAKALGKKLTPREGWDEMKEACMGKIVRAKFTQCATLGAMLLSTGNEELVHDCPWGDTYWGVTKGLGDNRLGEMLMKVRDELRKTTSRPPRV